MSIKGDFCEESRQATAKCSAMFLSMDAMVAKAGTPAAAAVKSRAGDLKQAYADDPAQWGRLEKNLASLECKGTSDSPVSRAPVTHRHRK